VVESKSLATRLSNVDVTYAVVPRAVEATIAIELVQGDFYGQITAHTTSVQNMILLYNTKVAGCMSNGVIGLTRPVMLVNVKEKLVIVAKADDGKNECKISFTPDLNCFDEDDITLGATKMHVKVTWSIVDLLVCAVGLAHVYALFAGNVCHANGVAVNTKLCHLWFGH
jgi:hypothetical protein